jgi:glycosyltransferase involved in cell wall biosynthesis
MRNRLLTSAADHAALKQARWALADHARLFHAFERHALAVEDPTIVAGRAALAFDVGWRYPPGAMVSAKLEQHLRTVGLEHVTSPHTHRRRTGPVERVLHVLTEAYADGGHTRVAERWMLADRGRIPTVAITGRSGGSTVPERLQAVAHARGGGTVAVTGESLLTRARNLRALASQHDLVVLHPHMDDVVPTIAFADPVGRPPTILFNHASHLIWAGVGAADVVANLRELDAQITRDRRGVPAAASLVLPIPVDARELPSRAAARDQLGIPVHAKLVLSVGSAYKMGSVVHPRFTDIVNRVLEVSPDAQLVVVGAHSDATWAALQNKWGERLNRLDRVPHAAVDALMAAADVLLDTWPISGGTTPLDASYLGLPVVSIEAGQPEIEVLRLPADGLDELFVRGTGIDDIAHSVAELLADPDRRRAIGERSRAYVDSHHVTGWTAHMEQAVRTAVEHAGEARPPALDPPPEFPDWECLLHLAYEAVANNPPLETLILNHTADLHADDRAPSLDAARARVEEILATASSRRAVAAPPVEPEAIARLLVEVRKLVAAGEIDLCVVTIPAPDTAAAIQLLEHALAAGTDVDVELVTGDDVEAIRQPGDRVLAA